MNHRYRILRVGAAMAICLAVAVPMTGLAQSQDDKGGHHGQDRGKQDNGKHQGQVKNNQDKQKLAKHSQDRNRGKDSGWAHNRGKDPKRQGLHDNRNQYWKNQQARRLREQNLRRTRQAELDQRLYSDGSNSSLDAQSIRRQKMKNEWRNIAILSGAVALLGVLTKDNRLVFAGAAGTLYSLYRYEQDRKSQSQIDRLRASYFSRSYFVRDGRRYERRTVTKQGQRYYQFVRR